MKMNQETAKCWQLLALWVCPAILQRQLEVINIDFGLDS